GVSTAASLQEIVDRHRPAGEGGLCLRPLAAAVDAGLGGFLRGMVCLLRGSNGVRAWRRIATPAGCWSYLRKANARAGLSTRTDARWASVRPAARSRSQKPVSSQSSPGLPP